MIIRPARSFACSSAFFFRSVDVDVAVRRRRHDHDLEAGHDRAGGIGAVRGGGNQDDVARAFAARLVIRAHHRQAGELTLRAGIGLQRHRGKARDLAQRVFELVADLAVAFGLIVGRERMHPRELFPRHRIHLARGVEFHRAGAERDHRRIEADVLALEAADVAHHLAFGAMRVEHGVRQIRALADQRGRPLRAARASASSATATVVCVDAAANIVDHRRQVRRRHRLVERDADFGVAGVAEVEVPRPRRRRGSSSTRPYRCGRSSVSK